MPTIRLTGRISPDIGLTTSGGPFYFHNPLIPITVKSFEISREAVSVECEIENLEPDTLNLMFFYVFPAIRSIVDAAAFVTGRGTTLILDTGTMPNGEKHPVTNYDPTLRGICSLSAYEILAMSMAERAIFKHLHDLTETLIDPFDAPINCARVVEGIAMLLHPDGEDRNKRWKHMRDSLNLSEGYLKEITGYSTGPRHGEVTPQSMSKIADIRKRGWIIASRFFEFRKLGSATLPVSEFPVL